MKTIIIVIILGMTLIVGCEDAGTTATENEVELEPIFQEIELNFFTVDKGPNSARNKGEFTIRSEFEYRSHFGVSSDGFNFGNEMVVVIYKGEVPLSEHSYSVTKIVEREKDILVTMKFDSCIECNTAPSAPFHVVGLDRNNKFFVFEESQLN